MARINAALAAALGLTAGIGPLLIAQIVPKVANLELLGVYILGSLISMSACVRR